MNSSLKKHTPTDLAAVGKDILGIGGAYIVHNGVHAYYKSKINKLDIEFKIESLADEKSFSCSRKIEKCSNDNLTSLANGKGTVIFSNNVKESFYQFTNGSRVIKINKHVSDGEVQPSIDEQLADLEEVVGPEKISTKSELSLTGREKKVCLIIRDETFTSISADCIGEHFFDPDSSEEVKNHPRLIQQSYFFLKIGKENFSLQLYKKNDRYWLLTEVSPGLGIHCRVLEKLTPHNRSKL